MGKYVPFGRPVIGPEEKEAVLKVLEGSILTHGPLVREFEKHFAQYTGAKHALAVSSCTAALHLCYLCFGLQPGDQMIVPAQTHVATAHAVELCGAQPVFVDSEEKTGNIDVTLIRDKMTEKTRAISLVHYLGTPADLPGILKIAKEYNVPVVEDCALALGLFVDNLHAGLHGDAGCFSFYPVKQITTGEGGMLITENDELAQIAAQARAFGIDRNIVAQRKVPGMYDVSLLGTNYRMNEIAAALGIEQLKKCNAFLQQRKENFAVLQALLENISEVRLLNRLTEKNSASYYCLSILLKESLRDRRIQVIEALKQKGVETSIYYPKPVPSLSYYKQKYGYRREDFPVAEQISQGSIALPVGPHLTADDMTTIATALKKVILQVKHR